MTGPRRRHSKSTTPMPEIITMRELQEQRWAYERRHLDRLRYDAMSKRATLPIEQGGLGYPITDKLLAKRVRDYLAFTAEAEHETRDEHRTRELAGMDARQQAHMEMVGRVDVEASIVAALRYNGQPMTIDEIFREAPECIVVRDEKIILAAFAAIERIASERRKLLGLDAPIEAHVVVTTAADQQLADLAAQLDLTPTTSPEGVTS